MMNDGMKRAALLLPVLLVLFGCPSTHLPNSIDVKLQESEEQRLILRNELSTPVKLQRQRSTQTIDLEPAKTVEIRFRVLSLRSYGKISGEPYYNPTPGAPPTNHFEEIDNLDLVDTATPAPQIHYRDPGGREHVISVDLDNCDPEGKGKGWEAAHWPSGDHAARIPGQSPGIPQDLCPNP